MVSDHEPLAAREPYQQMCFGDDEIRWDEDKFMFAGGTGSSYLVSVLLLRDTEFMYLPSESWDNKIHLYHKIFGRYASSIYFLA